MATTRQSTGIKRADCHLIALILCVTGLASAHAAGVPATSVMTVYRFNGPESIAYFTADSFARHGAHRPAGKLAQGSAVIPCLVVRNGKPLTDRKGTPYVGFEIVFDAATASPDAVEAYRKAVEQRTDLRVDHHHCTAANPNVVDARRLFDRDKPPWFDPPRPPTATLTGSSNSQRDTLIRQFHASGHCARVNRTLLGRRDRLDRAWTGFLAGLPADQAQRAAEAMHLDYVMRTAIYEGHIGRGCSAYGACERNVIALTIRNRALERCQSGQGCRSAGDFQGVSSAVAQYNIWDELLTQTSGLTSCFLREDLASEARYAKLRAMYEQSVGDVEKILFASDRGLRTVFPDHRPADVKSLRHYYHPPAMSPCFPSQPRIEYISAATASKGNRHVLVANRRIHADQKRGAGYRFRTVSLERLPDRDDVTLENPFDGFLIDARKVDLRKPRRCTPHGTPTSCRHQTRLRHRKTPGWLRAGQPTRIHCRLQARGEDCEQKPAQAKAAVGGICDREMQPVAGVR